LNSSTSDENAPFKHIGLLIGSRPTNTCQKLLLGRNGLGSNIHEHEASGAVSVLCHANAIAVLTKQCSLLITGDPSDCNWSAKKLCIA